MKPTTIAVDLAKNVFQIAVSDYCGKMAESHRITCKDAILRRAEARPRPPEACGSAHFWARDTLRLALVERHLPDRPAPL